MTKLTMLIPLLVACTTSNHDEGSKQSARRALITATSTLGAAKTRAANLTSTVDFTAPCGAAGSFSVDGSYDRSDDALHEKFDVTAGFDACSEGDGALDGNLHWLAARNADDFTSSLTGQLDWADSTTSASCTFDLHVTISATSASYSGTVCGYDINELDVDIDDLAIDTD